MTLIRTTCPRCGEVEMTAEAILLSVRHPVGDASYRFMCPSCLDPVEKRADSRIVALLVSAGVDLADPDQKVPDSPSDVGLDERMLFSDRPLFTPDDLIDFHFLLEDDALLAREFGSG